MSETAILTIGIIGAIGAIFAFVRWVLPIACTYSVKPRIKTRISLGKKTDVESPLTKEKLFTARDVSIWLCTNRNIDLSNVTFRRLCQYQKNCMLYRFMLKVGLLKDKRWCSYASVDHWEHTDTFICPTEEDERREQVRKHGMEGRLTLKPKVNRIVKDYWVALDMPLRLRDNKSHLVELTLSFRLNSEDTPFLNRLVSRALNYAGRETTYLYSERRKLYISCEDQKEVRKERKTTARASRDTGYRVVYSYHGLEEFAECQKILGALVSDRQSVLKKLNPSYSKVPAHEIRSTIKEDFPNTEIVFTQPPDGMYHMANEEDFKTITQMWSNVRQFALRFLNCESFTQLFRDYTKCFLLLPEILLMTHQYLVFASENPIMSIATNISNRSKALPIALVHVVYSECRFKVEMAKRKVIIRKRLDRIVSYFDLPKSESSHEGDVHPL